MAISVICAIVKNELRFIREWAEYYINIGFDQIYIYEDYDSDSHKELLVDLIKANKVCLINLQRSNLPIPKRSILSKGGKSTQNTLYKWFFNQCKTGTINADWVGFFDVDEFLMFEGGWDLQRLEEEFNDKAGILLSWKVFGSNNHFGRQERNVIDNYTLSMPEGFLLDDYIPINVKSLVNVKNCDHMNTIHVFDKCLMTDKTELKDKLCFEKAWLNHYYTKSWEDYLHRIFARGNMQNNFRSLDQFFKVNPELKDVEKKMIEEQRYKHTASTMWISRKYRIISGGNHSRLELLRRYYVE